MASTPLPPPPAPRSSSERDARTQRRLDAARAARARRRLATPTLPTLRQRLRDRTRPYHTFLQVFSLSTLAGACLTGLPALPLINYIEHQRKIAAEIFKPFDCVNDNLLELLFKDPNIDLEKVRPDIELRCKRPLR